MKKNCLKCGNNFTQVSNAQKYCKQCKKRKCLHCGNLFQTEIRFDCKYCSKECYINHRWAAKKCKKCGIKTKTIFCSKECRNKHFNSYAYGKKDFWDQKRKIVDQLGGKCKSCGVNDIRVLEINHIDRNKKKRPKNLNYTNNGRLKEWKDNMNNIELLCANCHRIHTYQQMGYGN